MSAATVKAGVMGWPVAHSLSPRLHGYWLKKYAINGRYEALPVLPEELHKALKDIHKNGFCGVNLTIPHKEAALKIVTRADALARRIGAVNTVIAHADGTLEGRNTDAFGFAQNLLAAGFKANAKPAVVLGAGGAARATVAALQDMNASEIRIVNRTKARAEALAGELGGNMRAFGWDEINRALEGAALLVNATSLGMEGGAPLGITLDALPVAAVVNDLVYAPLTTDLLKRAKARGNPVVDGLGMLLHQARPAFKAFFGVDPEVTAALRAFVLGEK